MSASRFDAFALAAGMDVEQPSFVCADCGFTSDNRKHFKKAGDGHTCATGHYEKDGALKRAKNPYARR